MDVWNVRIYSGNESFKAPVNNFKHKRSTVSLSREMSTEQEHYIFIPYKLFKFYELYPYFNPFEARETVNDRVDT